MMATLIPPRDPAGKAPDRRWTLVVFDRPRSVHVGLPGRFDDVAGAQAAAQEYLGHAVCWDPVSVPRTPGKIGPAWRAAAVAGCEACVAAGLSPPMFEVIAEWTVHDERRDAKGT